MLGRLIVFIAMVLFGPLYVEIYLYHPSIVREHDLAAVVPLVASPLGLVAGFLLLAADNRMTAWLFGIVCALEIMVGITGAAIHIALHRPDSLTSLVTDAAVWFGEPPPLVPLSFAAAGALGLLPLAMPGLRRVDTAPPAGARALAALAAAVALAATVAAVWPGLDGLGLVAALAALGLGSIGFAAEILTTIYAWWARAIA